MNKPQSAHLQDADNGQDWHEGRRPCCIVNPQFRCRLHELHTRETFWSCILFNLMKGCYGDSPMMDMGDEELMLQTQCGNVHAFELLFERYRTRVFGFILRMLNGKRQDAEDLMQDIFIKLFKAREMYEPRAKFSTWLFTIVRNHCLNFVRSRAYLQAQITGPLDPDDEPSARTTNTGPAVDRRSDLSERLELAIRDLPAQYKDVFLLRAMEGFSHDETARMLGMNPATVRTHFRRARLILAQQLESPASSGRGNGGMKP